MATMAAAGPALWDVTADLKRLQNSQAKWVPRSTVLSVSHHTETRCRLLAQQHSGLRAPADRGGAAPGHAQRGRGARRRRGHAPARGACPGACPGAARSAPYGDLHLSPALRLGSRPTPGPQLSGCSLGALGVCEAAGRWSEGACRGKASVLQAHTGSCSQDSFLSNVIRVKVVLTVQCTLQSVQFPEF